jgi:NADH:ubiquinone oxidoreductase subunit E
MLPVVSDKKMISGVGGMVGVCTVLDTFTFVPSTKVALNVCGSTPGAAAAGTQLTIKLSSAIGIASRSETSLCNVRLNMIAFI